ncbi:peptide/nickel transport system permease protein [Rhodococcoides kroppenstedtii]|uniref:Peptide/nickel transport system permease protein n=1 Tax=Rhodococcoides kroppenstedtii TaxID=293050 RepID=A0A1I0U311_9NOCA|nr:ABC transporter permease [Rhodococcus kroppenstedtii]SFA58442.1 peptide/nickel transport system permease protein [Rhodococcus kroppenstedtii]
MTATLDASGPAPADPTRRERPSAVTPKHLAAAGATRRARDSRLKIWVGSVCALIVILPVAFARVLPLQNPDATDLGSRRLPPLTDGHLFGTDQLGRDLLARILYGGQVSLLVGILAVLVSGLIGLVLGSMAGYFGGWVDTVVSRLLEAQLSLPLLMMLLLVVALIGPSIPVITFVIAIAQWPEIARLTRSLVLVEREKPYIAASRVLGLGKTAILTRHIVPNVIKQTSLVVLLLLAQAVLLESALSYLGAGPQRPFATWGRIISDGQDYITTSWWLVTLPGLVIVLLVIGVNLLGDGLRDRPAGSGLRALLGRLALTGKKA